ncbi:zinc ribbon domain-containing protein [Enorma phocaeensis]|uniref:zinc ribbon domain-containing protein n=1 Tax=Enorma phocaeensis TaxID=1871019 RepID=UPI000C8293FA|nr:zinc ribbon domain-containing protein [Enorma phocaeensis]
MECHTCHKQIADNSTFCPYCGMPAGGVQTGSAPSGGSSEGNGQTVDTHQEDLRGIGGYQPVSAPPRRRLPLPVLIALGIFGVIVGLFALLLIFSSCSRGSTGGGTVAAPALPTPFEGRVRLRPEGAMGVDFTVLDGESTLSIEGVDGGTMRLTAGLDLVSAESGSGVYRYDLDQLTIDGVSHPVEDIFFPGGVPADADSAIEAYVDALTNAQAQIIIPAGAVDGDVAGVWGIRYTEGGFPYPGLIPSDVGFIFTEIMVSVNDDGTFTFTAAMEAVGDDAASLDVSEAEIAISGTWQDSHAGNVSFQPETLRVTADGVPEEETSLSGIAPQIFAGVDTADVLRGIEGAPSDGSDDVEPDDAGDAASAAAGIGADAAQSAAEAQGEPSDDAADSAGGANDVDVSTITDWAFMETARMELGVPQYLDFTFEIGEPYVWEGTGMTVTPITFYQDGYVIASADCDEDGVPVKNMLPYTGDRY